MPLLQLISFSGILTSQGLNKFIFCLFYFLIFKSFKSLPDKTIDNQGNLKTTKLAKYKDDTIGYLTGSDRNAKINVLNYKLNQVHFYFMIFLEILFKLTLYKTDYLSK